MTKSKSGWMISLLTIIVLGLIVGGNAPVSAENTRPPGCGPKNQGGPANTGGALYVSPTFGSDHTLFMTVETQTTDAFQRALLKSSDGGRSWSPLTGPGDLGYLHDVLFSPHYAQDQTLYLSFDPYLQRLERSTDGGLTWVRRVSPQLPGLDVLVLYDANSLFLGVHGGPPGVYPAQGLVYSSDSGQTWQHLYTGGVGAVALSPDYDQDATILISASAYHWDGGILKSTDRGRTWQLSRDGMPWGVDGVTHQITFSPGYVRDRTVFSANMWGLYKSTDTGAHWMRIDDTLDPEHGPSMPNFTLSPRYPQDQTLWASGYRGWPLAHSTDGGASWQALPTAMLHLAAREVCAAGGACRIELFGKQHGADDPTRLFFYKSFDGGQTWQCLEDPTPSPTPSPAEVPEPATWLLLGGGLAGLAVWWRRHDARRWAERAIIPEDIRKSLRVSSGSGLRLPERARRRKAPRRTARHLADLLVAGSRDKIRSA